ncbi:hypothetical protein TrST_g12514 [Triparma strigata]|uniref:HMA domain-containing protein n=1 Tax=Triparma strigata TaxID=1606541 RepID=A0A9W7B7N8_9STRA|nr:hypothetical protein TrST_g12514 [Triparma strigata]
MPTYAFKIEGLMCQASCCTTTDGSVSLPSVTSFPHEMMLVSPSDVLPSIEAFGDLKVSCGDFKGADDAVAREVIDSVESVGFGIVQISSYEEYLAALIPPPPPKQPLRTSPQNPASNNDPLTLPITGMSCSSCVSRVTSACPKTITVSSTVHHLSLKVSLITSSARIEIEPYPATDSELQHIVSSVSKAIRSVGFGVPTTPSAPEHITWRNKFYFCVLFTIPLVTLHYSLMYNRQLEDSEPTNFLYCLMFLLCTPVQYVIAFPFAQKAYIHLTRTRSSGMDLLISLGTFASYGYSVIALIYNVFQPSESMWGEAILQPTFETSAMLLTFVTGGKWMESLAKGRTTDAVNKLAQKVQQQVTVCSPPPSTAKTVKNRSEVTSEDVLYIPPFSHVPFDGEITSSPTDCYVDESIVTGESTPVSKSKGSKVIGGSVNGAKGWNMKVSPGCESYVERIIKSVQEAQLNRAPIELYADRISAIFAPTIVGISVLTFFMWVVTGHSAFMAFLRAISVVVVACPCALGLATPTAVMVGCGVGAREGVLIRGGAVLESAQKANCVVFDKTGTLTLGSLTVTSVFSPSPPPSQSTMSKIASLFPSSKSAAAVPAPADPNGLVLLLAAAAEQGSEHPIGKAITNYFFLIPGMEKCEVPPVDDFTVSPGCGVTCSLSGHKLRVGKPSWLKCVTQCSAAVELDGELVGCINVHDEVRSDAKDVVSQLESMGVDVYICTGDESEAARRVAEECGISMDRVFTGVMPEEKGEVVENLKRSNKHVMFVGDGINDAIALVKADVGVGIGNGTSIAIESADVVLMRDGDLRGVLVTIDLAKVVFSRIRLNFLWATMYNFVSLPIASGALYPWTGWMLPPAFAGLAMACSSVTVVCSSLLLKRYTTPEFVGGDGVGRGAAWKAGSWRGERGRNKTEERGLLGAAAEVDSEDGLEMV